MKKNLIFVLGTYYPHNSANGIVIQKISGKLKNDYNIHIVAMKSSPLSENKEIIDGIIVHRIDNNDYLRRGIIENNMKKTKNKIKLFSHRFQLNLFRSVKYLEAILKTKNIREEIVGNFFSYLSKLNLVMNIDIIIPVCFPFETVESALLYKKDINPKVLVIPYLFDKFADSSTLHRNKYNRFIKFKKHLELEKKMLENSNNVLLTYDWKLHINKYFLNYRDKIIYADIPSVEQLISDKVTKYDKNKINLVYTGGLDKLNRSPVYFLKIIEYINLQKNNYVIHFYTKGNCQYLIDEKTKKNENIFNHGSVDVESAHSAILAADYLISIGNMDITQRPSKIFEYISSGKPIIHFYNSDKDPVIDILKKYPYSLCLDQKAMIADNYKELVFFINKYYKIKSLEYSFIENEYKKNTSNYFVEVLKNITV